MIAAIRDKEVLINLLKNCRAVFPHHEYDRIMTSILKSDLYEDIDTPLYMIIYADNSRIIFNGYGRKSIKKLFEMVRYIVHSHGEIFPTKLNKLMFYCDFCHYREFGLSISGLTYRALNFGPVPDHYATIYDNVPGLEKKFIEAQGIVSNLRQIRSSSDECLRLRIVSEERS